VKALAQYARADGLEVPMTAVLAAAAKA